MKVEPVQINGSTPAVPDKNSLGNITGGLDNRESPVAENMTKEEYKNTYTRDEIEKALNSFKESVDIFNRRLHFQVHDQTNRIQVQVIDAETKEILKEIPPEKILDLLAAFQQLTGIVLDLKA